MVKKVDLVPPQEELNKDGKPEGLWEYFNIDGSLQKTKTFEDGVEVN